MNICFYTLLYYNKFFIDKIDHVILGPGQFDDDQKVDYVNYPPQIIDYIENDSESAVYQIFIVFKKTDLALDPLLKHNLTFKDNLKISEEEYTPKNSNNPIKILNETVQKNNLEGIRYPHEAMQNHILNSILSQLTPQQ